MLTKSFCHCRCHLKRWIWVIVASSLNNISNQVTDTETKHVSSQPQTSPTKHSWCYIKIKNCFWYFRLLSRTKSLSHMHSRGSSENLIRSFSTSALCSSDWDRVEIIWEISLFSHQYLYSFICVSVIKTSSCRFSCCIYACSIIFI